MKVVFWSSVGMTAAHLWEARGSGRKLMGNPVRL